MPNYTIWINVLSRTQPEILPFGLTDELDPHALGYHDSPESVESLFAAIASEFPEVETPTGKFLLEIVAELEDEDGRYHDTHGLLIGDFETVEQAMATVAALGEKYYHDCTPQDDAIQVVVDPKSRTVAVGFLNDDDEYDEFIFNQAQTEELIASLQKALATLKGRK